MGLKSFFKKVGKGLKKALPYVAPIAGLIPGVGPAISGAIGTIGGMFSKGTSAAQPPSGPGISQADVDAAAAWDVTPTTPGTYTSAPVNISAPRPSEAPPWWSQALGTLGSAAQTALPAYLSYMGQQKANQANASAAQAQMDFQASQTGSSYQRGVADMKAAGLNPMLAYSQGGAASGTGASYQSGSELGAGVASAFQASMQRQQIANMQSTIGVNNADIKLKGTLGETEATRQALNTSHADQAEADAARSRAEALRIAADIPGVNARSARDAVEAFIKEQTQQAAIQHANSAAKFQEMHARREEVLGHLSKQEVPEAEAYARYYSARGLGEYDPHARSVGKWASAARDASNALNPLAILKGISGMRGKPPEKGISNREIEMILGR